MAFQCSHQGWKVAFIFVNGSWAFPVISCFQQLGDLGNPLNIKGLAIKITGAGNAENLCFSACAVGGRSTGLVNWGGRLS